MDVQQASEINGLHTCVRITEAITTLPAVATQDWCHRAAQSLNAFDRPAFVLVLIASIRPDGSIVRQEATGVAGAYPAQITTTMGSATSQTSRAPIDANDTQLAALRAGLAQADHLGWAPGGLEPEEAIAGTATDLLSNDGLGRQLLERRWTESGATMPMLGAVGLPTSGEDRRLLVAELGMSGDAGDGVEATSRDAGVLQAVLPALARRARLAIGGGESDSATWLTPKEQLILQHLLLGKSVRAIAEELGRSPHTVHDHVKSLHKKLNASSRGELVARALGHVEPKASAPQSSSIVDAKPTHARATQ